jgi:3-phenylpropionate/cinnamic acid dioxygenase small subunit
MATPRERIEEFLFHEAKLIDEHRYDEWLALWTEDCLYWVPCNSDDADPARQAMIIYDNRARLDERVYRLTSGAAWAQQPRSRTRRLISNVEVRETHSDDPSSAHSSPKSSFAGYAVESNCLIVELRRSRQDLFAARILHTMRPAGDSFRIALKKVLLLNNDEAIDNLTFLV